MNPVFTTALHLQDFCQSRGWACCLIGGVAVQRWGQPRVTGDADLTLLTGFGGEEVFVDALLARFKGRRKDTRKFALHTRVLLLEDESGVAMDVSLGGLPYEERVVERSSDFDLAPGLTLRTCSAEDLIVLKAFAGRPIDWQDVETIVWRQRRLDTKLIFRELRPLLEVKDAPENAERLRKILRKARSIR